MPLALDDDEEGDFPSPAETQQFPINDLPTQEDDEPLWLPTSVVEPAELPVLSINASNDQHVSEIGPTAHAETPDVQNADSLAGDEQVQEQPTTAQLSDAPVADSDQVLPLDEAATQQGAITSSPAEGDDGFGRDLLDVYISEAREQYRDLSALIAALPDGDVQAQVLVPVRRGFHTLKGSGRLVGAKEIAEFSWANEKLLNRLLEHPSAVADAKAGALLRAAMPLLQTLIDFSRGPWRAFAGCDRAHSNGPAVSSATS